MTDLSDMSSLKGDENLSDMPPLEGDKGEVKEGKVLKILTLNKLSNYYQHK